MRELGGDINTIVYTTTKYTKQGTLPNDSKNKMRRLQETIHAPRSTHQYV